MKKTTAYKHRGDLFRRHILPLLLCGVFCIASTNAFTQPTGERSMTPLADVLKTLERIYDVSISFQQEYVEGKLLEYAPWRIRGDIHTALKGVLDPFGLGYYNAYGTNRFRVNGFEYYRWSVAEGEYFLRQLNDSVKGFSDWEIRRIEVINHLNKTLSEALPLQYYGKIYSEHLSKEWQERDGYRFRNVALEYLPGVYVSGTVYAPASDNSAMDLKYPVMLCPTGHWEGSRYREDHQLLCASLARMGAIACSYDLFAWGESALQFDAEDHQRAISHPLQVASTYAMLEYLTGISQADKDNIGITGGSGAGSHSILISALLPDVIKVCVPVVSLSCHFFGGCPCESGLPIHVKDGAMFTNNPEIAALSAPRPMLVVSDGQDWTFKVPELEFPYLQRIYGLYSHGPNNIANIHFEDEGHDFGPSKREAVYRFLITHMRLKEQGAFTPDGLLDESGVTIEPIENLLSFGMEGEFLPSQAIRGYDQLTKLLKQLDNCLDPSACQCGTI